MTAARLRPKEADVVRLLTAGMTGTDVARHLGVSRQRVHQIWKRAMGIGMPAFPARQPIDRDSRNVRRFWARVSVDPSGCWLWTGALYPSGYGSNRSGYAHRAVYEALKGPIPTGLTIDHLCRVRACVNPAHLEAVTQRENTLRSPIALAAINARKTHCKRGHPFSDENTATDRRTRRCRTCARAAQRAAYQRRQEVAA